MQTDYLVRKLANIFFMVLLIILISFTTGFAQWKYNWDVRTDRDGKPAGYFSTTPFPVDETISAYSITNDEGTKTFSLGTICFVDNATTGCLNGSTNYIPSTRSCGVGGAYTVYTSIANAISAMTSGNKTILVRDGRNYNINSTVSFSGRTGTDDTHRYALIGYNQERPILDCSGIASEVNNCIDLYTGSGNAYLTIQRMKVQNNKGRGIGGDTGGDYVNLIDIWAYNNCTQIYNGGTTYGADGNIHLRLINYAWLYHNTSEHTYMKCYKVADGSPNAVIEWNVANECGYWTGIPHTPYAHPYGFDMAADGISAPNSNLKFRYNIAGTALYGNECRWCDNISVHHNEFYDPCHADAYIDDAGDYTNASAFHLLGTNIYGDVYSNVFRDNTDSKYPMLLGLSYLNYGNSPYLNVYNNIMYSTNYGNAIRVSPGSYSPKLRVYNNTIYINNAKGAISVNSDVGGSTSIDIANNIIHQQGSGTCLDLPSSGVTWDYNLYYFPYGSRGENAGTHDVNSGNSINPLWANSPPWGALSTSTGNVASGSPAKDTGASLSSFFTTDFHDKSRPQSSSWDIGAIIFSNIGGISPPGNLRILR